MNENCNEDLRGETSDKEKGRWGNEKGKSQRQKTHPNTKMSKYQDKKDNDEDKEA